MNEFLKKIFENRRKNKSEQPEPLNTEENQTLKFLNTEYVIEEEWLELFTHFVMLDKHNKMPLKSWYEETKVYIEKIGEKEFVDIGSKWILDCIEKSKESQRRFQKLGPLAANEPIQSNLGFKMGKVPEWVTKVYGKEAFNGGFIKMENYVYLNNFQNYFYQSIGGRILRGFLQSAVVLQDGKLISLVDQIALTNPNTSQDAIHVYSQLAEEISIPRLTNLKSKAKNKNIIKRIDKAIGLVGKKYGKSKAEIEESVIPDFNIDKQGAYKKVIGGISCVFAIKNIKENETYYVLENGKKQKSVPKLIKDDFATDLKVFRKQVKEIKTSLTSHKKRIEAFYLIARSIPYASFIEHYFGNNLVKILSKNLIWNFKNGDQNVNLIYHNDMFIDANGEAYTEKLEGTSVSLWHPIGFESDYIFKWRSFILENEILQPFKQAFREIYIITEAELNTETYSNRFASHILNKDHVSALCKVRGWSPSGIINSGRATYKIPESDYKIEYLVSDVYLGEYSKTYGSAHISTDQIRFNKKRTQIHLTEVPAIIFSEVMRDVDLFVGVTSIGNDPEWHDRGDEGSQHYWSSYSNASLTARSKTRAEILKNLIPKMKIADRCDFEGKYLKVKGSLRNYKIHMGSGNILMEPNDQYLCIVPDSTPSSVKRTFIPFEGDKMLSIIISKALLLADDEKITIPGILSQINRK